MKGHERNCCFTCDVEISTEENVRELERIIEIFDRESIKATFFIEILPINERILKAHNIFEKILSKGIHEVGLHIHWKDSIRSGIKHYTQNMFRQELRGSLGLFPGLSPHLKSFRAGGLCCSSKMHDVLSEFGFLVDSSVAARLNEPIHWRQGHKKVPYISSYFPDKDDYWRAATNSLENTGILEIPVSRLIPSWRFWRLCTLQPGNPLNKIIIKQRLSWKNPGCLLTVIMHSWGCGRNRGKKYSTFLIQTKSLIHYLKRKNFRFWTLQEIRQKVMGEDK
ncbi:MAG: hypothetical protein MUP52_02575 [Candidatus Aminicenantes bacterium]|nr:hypothetical protein [Candidatus Aminicenantes bacterium]